jgi:hypothetical protein
MQTRIASSMTDAVGDAAFCQLGTTLVQTQLVPFPMTFAKGGAANRKLGATHNHAHSQACPSLFLLISLRWNSLVGCSSQTEH